MKVICNQVLTWGERERVFVIDWLANFRLSFSLFI
jgi:hypothetical protein